MVVILWWNRADKERIKSRALNGQAKAKRQQTFYAGEKGCLINGEKLTRQCRKSLWVMVVFTVARVNVKVFQRGGRKQHKGVFVLSRSLLLNHLEPQSRKAKLLLPIMQISTVAFFLLHFGGTTFAETVVFPGLKP